MKKRFRLKKLIITSIICSLSLSLSGCSLTGFIDRFRDPDKLSKELHESPRFWNDATPYSESDGLFVLYNEFFQRKPYNNIMGFGDNILLIGQGTYLNDVNDLVNTDSMDFEYSFAVYNPWNNQVTASLDHDDILCDDYQIVGDCLFLFNYEKNTIDVYDAELNFSQRYNASSLGSLKNLKFYTGDEDDSFLSYNNKDNQIQKIDSSTFEPENLDFDMYKSRLEDISPDGSRILLSGIDKTSLKYVIAAYDTSTLKQTDCVYGQNYSVADISENGFITGTKASDNEWAYYNSSEENEIRFSMTDIRNAMILPDNTFILHQEEAYDEETDSHEITYYHISSSGETLSSFTFDCGDPNMAGYTYFSSDFAYLKDCNCIMFLAYTTDVNPYVLVWDLNVEKTDSNVLVDASDDKIEKEITDWGNLAEANELASSLEQKYGISIFIGEEVPTEIDVFSASQDTNPEEIISALNNLDRLLNCYPKNFFPQLCYGDIKGLKIYLTGDIQSNSKKMIDNASGVATTIDSYLVITLDITYSWDWDYTVNHEISHMIDKRLEFYAECEPDSLFSEDNWDKFNPDTFEYMNSYDGYETNSDYYIYSSYFIDSYGTTFATEDRAEIFGRAMDNYLSDINDDMVFEKESVVYNKLKYYSQCIRDGFDTSEWDSSVPWEMVISK